ncbi:MAG TPA: cytochrome C assembly protein [Methanosarcinaceae archaeon]|nr:cytochrome C assembly protein [Methanosarcinaceae archaeon]
MSKKSNQNNLLSILTAVVMLIATYMIFFSLPIMRDESGEILDNSFNIFYFHLPIAITSYLAFFVVFVASILYLKKGTHNWDVLARSSAEVGSIFALLVLVTGSIWAKATWGWYWIWEPRLTTSLALFLVYLAYLLMRQAIEEPEKRARLSAVFGIIGFASVPLSFLSIRMWRTHHPLMFGSQGSGGGGLEGTSLQLTLLVNLIAFFLLFATILSYKVQNEKLQEIITEKKQALP